MIDFNNYKAGLNMIIARLAFSIMIALDKGDIEPLRDSLLPFCSDRLLNGHDSNAFNLDWLFVAFNPNNILVGADPVWEKYMLGDNLIIDTESTCGFSMYNSQPYLRWVIPSADIIKQVTSLEKLAYTAMIVMEELCHTAQRIDLHTLSLFSIGVRCHFPGLISDLPKMSRDKLMVLLESDVTSFMDLFLPMSKYSELQWYADRLSSQDGIHYPLPLDNMLKDMLEIAGELHVDQALFGKEIAAGIYEMFYKEPGRAIQFLTDDITDYMGDELSKLLLTNMAVTMLESRMSSEGGESTVPSN